MLNNLLQLKCTSSQLFGWYEGTTSVSISLICLLPRYVLDRPLDGNQNNSGLLNYGLHSL